MAEDPDQPAVSPGEAVACSACRGSGVVISNLGGAASELACPWCEGGGVRLAEHDAQAQRRADGAGAGD